MSDAILRVRIDALDDNLRRLMASLALFQGTYGDALPYPELWEDANAEIDRRVEACDRKIADVRTKLDTPPVDERKAWELYTEAQEQSADLFQGCLEFIGGVAFRSSRRSESDPDPSGDDQLYERIWRVADQLVRDSAYDALTWRRQFLTVPALEEALSDSLARTVRLRFPEWTIWTLPLLAYDFGLVAIEWQQSLKRYPFSELVETQTTRLVGEDAELEKRQKGVSPEAAKKLERGAAKWWRHRVRVLLADAFAVYTMGPAYACAAIHLRFDPSAAYAGSPSYDERARVVLESLRQIDRQPPGKPQHADFIDALEGAWQSAVEGAEPPDPRDAAHARDLNEKLLPAFADELEVSVPSAARFSKANWADAAAWQLSLLTLFQRRRPLRLDFSGKDKLRDVLNAVWLARIENPAVVNELTRRAPELCEELVRVREEAQQTTKQKKSERERRVRGPTEAVRP